MRLLFDCSGGDNAPIEVVKGALEARESLDIDVSLIGIKDEIKKSMEELDYHMDSGIEIIDAKEKIENEDEPTLALRRKKDSSIVKGLNLLKEDKYDAFISCGSTGALLAGGLFIVGRIKNIKRAVLPTSISSLNGKVMVIDSGANMDCDENLILQFAKMGSIYLESLGIKNPRVGLLNVGTEKGKGNSLTKKSYNLLEKANLNFIGNIEARDVTLGVCDLVVCDGFVGNVLLKNTEGVAGFIFKMVENEIKNSDINKNSLNDIKKILGSINKKLDYKEIGGVILLGLNKTIVKGHGSSDARAIKNAAKAAVEANNKDIINKLKNNFIGEEI